jgi:phospholipid/cholesterol/gamma-HCH transport system substrate-binding protein
MSNSIKNFIIGLFLLSSVGVLVGLVMFLRPSVGDEKQTLLVRFSSVNKINVGTRVLFAGKAIGEVTAINEIYHARETQPTDSLGRLYIYQLTLKIDSNVHVYSTDEICMQTSGLLGEKSIAIIPRVPPKGITPELITDKTPFYADSVDPLENTLNRMSDISNKLDTTVGLVKNWFIANEPKLSQSVSSFDAALRHVDHICKDISSGQGTLGKLVKADDMYLRMTAVMSKADTMMNDINNYGILFHLNKTWQRANARRISQLNALETPVAFKDYFQTEVDRINMSMERISMLIEKARADEKQSVLESPVFRDNFAELLRQVDGMSDNLRLYNQQYTQALKP